jgi:type II secretion system protein J
VDASGDARPALYSSATQDVLLEVTHTGWDNPRGQRRGNVQRVRYRLDTNGDLWRDHWLVLDRFDEEDQLQSVLLLSGVEQCKFEFLDGGSANAEQESLGGEWVELWPATNGDTLLPLAVRFELELKDIGVVRRVIGLANVQEK